MSRNTDMENELDRELKGLPDVDAPDSLAADVLSALGDRKPLAWYQRPYYTWGGKGKDDFDDIGSIDDSYVATGVAARQQYREIGERADEAAYGTMSPVYSAYEYETIGAWDRLKATVVDVGVFFAASLATGWDLMSSLIVWMVYHAVFWALVGKTLGGMIFGQKVERAAGGKISFGAAIVRALFAVVSAIPLGLGYIWASWDVGNQSWHDKVAGTVAMRSRKRR